MEALQCGLVLRRRALMIICRFNAQHPKCCRSSLLFSVPLLSLLFFFLLSSQTVVLSLWNALNGRLEASPGFAFLLLNCLIGSLIASYRKESSVGASRRHEEEEEETQILRGISGLACNEACKKKTLLSSTEYNGNDGLEEVIFRGNDRGKREEQTLARDGGDHKIGEEKASIRTDKGHLNNGAARKSEGECKRNVKMASIKRKGDEERGLLRAAIIRKGADACADSSSTNGIQKASSAEEVWAAIMSAKTRRGSGSRSISGSISSRNGDCREHEKEDVGSADHTRNEAVAPATAVIISKNIVAAVAHRNNLTNNNNEKKKDTKKKSMNAACGVEATHQYASSSRRVNSDERPAAGSEVLKKQGNQEEREDGSGREESGDQEVAELNRRAEEFIARFSQQMRLQRLDSFERRRCPPNYGRSTDRTDVRYLQYHHRHHHLLPPAPPSPAQYGLFT